MNAKQWYQREYMGDNLIHICSASLRLPISPKHSVYVLTVALTMSAASLSMSMAATASPSSSSSLLNNVVSNLSFTIPLPTHHQFHLKSKPITPKPLKLNTHFPNFSSFSLLSHSHLCRASPSLDFSQESTFTEQYEEEDEEEATKSEEEFEDEVEEDEKVSDSSAVGRLYVGNLPYSMSSSQLSEVFGEAGRVVSVEVVYDRVTDRSRGFAFVTMGSVEEAKEAIRMFDRSQVGGRSVKVNFPEVPKGGERAVMQPKVRSSYEGFVDSPNKIYAGNLGWSITSESLREVFADHSGVLSAKVVYDRDSGRSRGFGFVSFESAEDAQSALNSMNGVEVEGRALRLNLAKERSNGAPPAVEKNTEVDSRELLSSVST